jgi:5'-3' exonuclease
MSHILVDLSNTFYRARFSINGDVDLKLGMAFHITLHSIKKAWEDFDGSHVVVFLEGRSWRKDYYPPYKRNRSDTRAAHTEKEAIEEKVFWEAYEKLANFLTEKTNCTVLQHPRLEADDLIAGWIQNHPNDNHVIISTDSDFYQLIAPNVRQYNGVSETTVCESGFFDVKGKLVIDKKTNLPKPPPDPQWLLFEKCIRGDTSDNVFSAYPGVRTKGTKNKVGLLEAFEDKKHKGFSWNNLMLQKWTDHNGTDHRVLDDYNRNCTLIDLTKQPPDVRAIIDETIRSVEPKSINQVGSRLIKFCGLYDLKKISDQSIKYASPLGASYTTNGVKHEQHDFADN